jgi:antitoxin YefM
MRTITYSEARQNLARTLDRVIDDAEEVVITRIGHEPTVIVSLREYESLKETAYLMASPANARRLQAAVDRARAGQVEQHELIAGE